jgi:aminopeptidase-like protein
MTRVAPLSEQLEDAGIGEEIYALAAAIYPICRRITGDGVPQILDHLPNISI